MRTRRADVAPAPGGATRPRHADHQHRDRCDERGASSIPLIAADTDQQANGLIPASVEPDAMAGVFTALGLGVIAQSAIDGSAPDTAAVDSQFLQLLARPDTSITSPPEPAT